MLESTLRGFTAGAAPLAPPATAEGIRGPPRFSEPALKFDFGIALECWLASRRAPERSRQWGKRAARPPPLDPGVKQNWQPPQRGKPELGAAVAGAKRQHAGTKSSSPDPRHDSRSD